MMQIIHQMWMRIFCGGFSPAHLYQLNRRHVAAAWIEGLTNLRQELIQRLRELLTGWEEPPRCAFLFGSIARGQASSSSDIDLLVIRPRGCNPDSEPWRAQLLELQRSARAWTGNEANVLEYGEAEVARGSAEPLFEDVLRDGIELLGSRRTLRRLLKSGAGQ